MVMTPLECWRNTLKVGQRVLYKSHAGDFPTTIISVTDEPDGELGYEVECADGSIELSISAMRTAFHPLSAIDLLAEIDVSADGG